MLIENWRVECNTFRPHSSLGYQPPAPKAVLPRSSLEELNQRKRQLEGEVSNLVAFVARGNDRKEVEQAIRQTKAQIKLIDQELDPRQARAMRKLLQLLPPDLARQVGCGNPRRLFGLGEL